MARTKGGILTRIRARLGYPPHDALSNDTISQFLDDKTEHYNTLLKLTSQKWISGSFLVTAKVDTDTEIPVGDFGRLDMVCTHDDQNAPNFKVRELDKISVEDRNLHWNGFKEISGNPLYPHNSTHVAVYRDKDSRRFFLQFTPPPFIECRYEVWYEPMTQAAARLAADPNFRLENFYNLIAYDTAMECLPILKMKKVIDNDDFKAMAAVMQPILADYRNAFDRYVLEMEKEDAGSITPFNAGRRQGMDDWGVY